MHTINKICPICKKSSYLQIDDEEYKQLNDIMVDINKVLHKRDDFFKQMFTSGMCYECQSEQFNIPVPGDTSWGEPVFSCSICFKNMYSIKHREALDNCYCHFCNTRYYQGTDGNWYPYLQ